MTETYHGMKQRYDKCISYNTSEWDVEQITVQCTTIFIYLQAKYSHRYIFHEKIHYNTTNYIHNYTITSSSEITQYI